MNVLTVANVADADAGLVGERLVERGATLSYAYRESPADWPSLERFDVVLSLGSEWSVYWDHVAEPVTAELELLRRAHAQQRPVLGICFGSQLLAAALGGVAEVSRAPTPEIGWHDVEPGDAAPKQLTGPWFQWHYDRWRPPSGSELLATSPLANQAFRSGRTLAVQFHPEVTVGIISRWLGEGGRAVIEALGHEHDAFVADASDRMPEVQVRAAALVDWFLDEVAR